MGVLDNAVNHFEAQERIEYEVPEWGNDKNTPLIIYADPVTLADRSICFEKAGGTNLTFYIYLIIRMAKDKDGKQLFKAGDKATLLYKVDPDVVQRVGTAIARADSFDDLEKK